MLVNKGHLVFKGQEQWKFKGSGGEWQGAVIQVTVTAHLCVLQIQVFQALH